jgi:Lon protease-like protein
MADESSIQVNFGKPMPLFPLNSVVLLPQQVVPLHIHEPRYIQMVEQSLDGSGQVAMAVFEGEEWKQHYHGRPRLRPAVCVGQILRHEKLPEGKYNILLQGICRAKIVEEAEPCATRLFREALLEPVGVDDGEEYKLYGVRERLTELLEDGPLSQLSHATWVVERIRDEEIPTGVILELVSFALPTRREMRYRLLAEADVAQRADLIEHELLGLHHMIRLATAQHPEQWPKGVSWN